MRTSATRLEDIQRRVAGLIYLLIGIVGGIVLLVATGSRSGIGAYGTFYAPVTFVVLALALFVIIFIEGGLQVLSRSSSMQVERPATPAKRAFDSVVLAIMALGFLAVLGRGVIWAVEEIAAGLTPTTETFITAGVLLVYASIRIPIGLGWISGRGLAHAIGIRRAGPELGESRSRYAARTLVGFAVGVLALDALLVLVNALVAPGDRTFYPRASTTTAIPAFLWIVGLLGVSWLATQWIRTGRVPRSVRATIAAIALLPAVALDARIPLYPLVAGISSGNWRITINDTPVFGSKTNAPTPFVARTPTATAVTSAIPGGATVSGLVRWGEAPVRFVSVGIVSNGRVSFARTDGDGRYQAVVAPGPLSASVDVGAISLATWFTGSRPGQIQMAPGVDATYPTIQLTRRIVLTEPRSGVSVTGPMTFTWQPQWQSVEGMVTYELRVLDDAGDGASPAVRSAVAFSGRTTQRSLTIPALPGGRRYRWAVEAYLTPRSGPEMLIGQATMSPFTTR